MLDIVRDYLQEAASPEVVAMLTTAHATFERIGLSNYESGFEELVMLNEQSEIGATVIYVTELTLELQKRILAEHGVIAAEDASFSVSKLNKFIEAILDLQDYSDTTAIARTLEMTGRPEELFAEILTLVTDESADNLLNDIESVNQFLITRIKEISNKDTEVNTIIDTKYIDKLLSYYEYLGSPPPLLNTLMEVLLPGYGFKVYISSLGRQLELLPEVQAARELVGMAFISRDGFDNPRAIIKEHIATYIASIDQITRIDVAVNEILLGMNQHEQS